LHTPYDPDISTFPDGRVLDMSPSRPAYAPRRRGRLVDDVRNGQTLRVDTSPRVSTRPAPGMCWMLLKPFWRGCKGFSLFPPPNTRALRVPLPPHARAFTGLSVFSSVATLATSLTLCAPSWHTPLLLLLPLYLQRVAALRPTPRYALHWCELCSCFHRADQQNPRGRLQHSLTARNINNTYKFAGTSPFKHGG